MVDTISLTGSNGDQIVFDEENFILEIGLRGFGIPVPIVRIDKSASDGGVFRFSKRDIRELDFPIMVIGSDRFDLEAKLRRLALILKGAVTIRADFENERSYDLVAYYNGGAETIYGEDASSTFARWTITLQAPQPFWTSSIPKQFSVAASASGARGLLAAATGTKTLSRLLVKTSQALGNVNVENEGDVAAPVVWQIKGPSDNVTITLNGVGFSYTETLTSSDTITIDTEAGTVKNQSGVNKYAFLSSSPKLFSIPSGISTISITATGTDTSNSKISGFYNPRFEVIH
jgi:phage-related protein